MLRKWILVAVLLGMAACTAPPAKKTEPEKTALPHGSYRAYAVKSGINIRKAPGTKSARLRKTEDGEEFRVLENKNGWLHVETVDKQQGWIRSDFVGPENLSYAKKSSDFLDHTLKDYKAEMFIDEKKPYEVIYLILEPGYYASISQAARRARDIGLKYQQQVWPGQVEIRVMNPDKKTLFTRVTLPATDAAGLMPPLLKKGRLYSMDVKNRRLTIKALVPASLNRNQLLDMADGIAASYGDAIRRVDIVLVADNPSGLAWLQNGTSTPGKGPCLLYYFEDEQGSEYKFNTCP